MGPNCTDFGALHRAGHKYKNRTLCLRPWARILGPAFQGSPAIDVDTRGEAAKGDHRRWKESRLT